MSPAPAIGCRSRRKPVSGRWSARQRGVLEEIYEAAVQLYPLSSRNPDLRRVPRLRCQLTIDWVRFWWPVILGVLLVAFIAHRDHWLAGKPHLSAEQAAADLGSGAGNQMSDIVCHKGGKDAGWDYICTFNDPRLGQMKEGVQVVRMGSYTTIRGGGSVAITGCVPPNPTKHGAISDCST